MGERESGEGKNELIPYTLSLAGIQSCLCVCRCQALKYTIIRQNPMRTRFGEHPAMRIMYLPGKVSQRRCHLDWGLKDEKSLPIGHGERRGIWAEETA